MTEAPERAAPRLGRIRKRAEYDRVFRSGARAWDDRLTVVVARGDDAALVRLGTAVSRRIGNAVRRNRVRRRIRAAFRAALGELPPGLDLVVLPSRALCATDPPFPAMRESIRALALRALSKLAAKERREGAA